MTQATMQLKIEEAFKTNFSVFDTYDEAVKKQQIQKISYIEKIDHSLEKNIHGVNLFDIFPNNNNIIIAEESEINTILIGFDRASYFDTPEPEIETGELSEDQITSVNKVFEDIFKNRSRDIQNDINSYMNNAASRMRDYHEYLRQASAQRQMLETIKVGDSNPMVESINKVLGDKRCKLLEFIDHRTTHKEICFEIRD